MKLGLPIVASLMIYCTAAISQNVAYSIKEEMLVLNGDTLFGTTYIPNTKGKHPHALIIAGSGPTDRNGNNAKMTNNSLKKLAEALAEKGIASTRYDKRGIAASKNAGKKESETRFDDMIKDAEDWIAYLKKHYKKRPLVVIGHSEGSLIGMLTAEKQKAGAFISLAGPGRAADVVLKEQLANLPGELRQVSFEILDSLKAGFLVNDIPPQLASLFRPAVQPYIISWFKYDPAIELKKLNVPVMIVQGDADLQVSVEDAELLYKASPDAEFLIVENMNHIFFNCTGGRDENLSTYNDDSLQISKVMTDGIIEFVKKQKGLKHN